MENIDVLVVGGGPAGSCCAERLRRAGFDVLLIDSQLFPRQKPCAGWITPQVFKSLALDPDEYRLSGLLQDISSFQTGLMNGKTVTTRYGKTVSYGILRSEFDHYLLQHCQVRKIMGEPVTSLERIDGWWIANRRFRTRLLIGAGGHFCPVARILGATIGREEIISAQFVEYEMSPSEESSCSISANCPALFFFNDMQGYGWLFRKGRYLNIGLGRMDKNNLPRYTNEFYTFLKQNRVLAPDFSCRFLGHAYRPFSMNSGRFCVSDGALLIGDAAGVANPHSGEGILPAIESALMAVETILEANGDYRIDNIYSYTVKLKNRFGSGSAAVSTAPVLSGFVRSFGANLLSSKHLTRYIVLNRWFLHSDLKPLNQNDAGVFHNHI